MTIKIKIGTNRGIDNIQSCFLFRYQKKHMTVVITNNESKNINMKLANLSNAPSPPRPASAFASTQQRISKYAEKYLMILFIAMLFNNFGQYRTHMPISELDTLR